MKRSRLALLSTLALAATALLAGCSDDPPELTETIDIDLGDIALQLQVPQEYELSDWAISSSGTFDAQVVIYTHEAHRTNLALASVSPERADPDEEPLNGHFPSWGSVDQLPADAVALSETGDFATIHSFNVEYTECTNSCTDYTRPVTFYELPDGRTFFASGFKTDASYEPMLATLRLR